jgi:hypothetical protein
MIIVEPQSVFADRSQSSAPTRMNRADPTEGRITGALRGIGVCKLWTLLNVLSEQERHLDRSAKRRLRLELLRRVRMLRVKGIIFGVGRNSVALEKPSPKPRRPRTRTGKRSVRRTATFQAVSAPIQRNQQSRVISKDQVDAKLITIGSSSDAVDQRNVKTQSAEGNSESKWHPFNFELLLDRSIGEGQASEVGVAAAALAKRPRSLPKKWSGYLDPDVKSTRLWRGRRLITPDGKVVNAVGARRGLVLTEWADPYAIDGRWHQVFKADQLRVFKDPAAVVLGRCKLGTKERPSALKSETARRNGCAACRPGSRPRGRPPKSSQARAGILPRLSSGTNR